jgi:FkbM family methyltransferase
MFDKARGTAAAVVAAVPGMPWLLKKAALAPPAIKTPGFARVATAIASRCLLDTAVVETNMGLSDSFHLSVPPNKGALLFGRPNHGVAERATIALVRALAPWSDAFLDVGANEGLFTFSLAADLPPSQHSKIHCFEPDADLFARLRSNLAKNTIGAHVNNIAVSDIVGRQVFYRNLTDDSSGSLTTHFAEYHKTIATAVETTTLAHYLVEHSLNRACVKIDVEGAGVSVWSGTRTQRDRIAWLVMEIIGPETDAQLPGQIITETGWNGYYIRDYELVPSRAGEFEYVTPFYNWLFTSADLSALRAALAGTALRIV